MYVALDLDITSCTCHCPAVVPKTPTRLLTFADSSPIGDGGGTSILAEALESESPVAGISADQMMCPFFDICSISKLHTNLLFDSFALLQTWM